jgi:hypothetical protein
MDELTREAPPATPARPGATRGLAWIACGFALVVRGPVLWLGMTAIYFLIALLLLSIPFAGSFVLILITPIMLAGALLAARAGRRGVIEAVEPAPAAPGSVWRRLLQALLKRPARTLFQVLSDTDRTLAVLIVCIVSLGLTILVAIPELLLTGGSMVSGLTSGHLADPLRPTMVAAMITVAILYLLLAMGLLYLVPLTLFAERLAIPAVAESFRACARNFAPLAVFVTPFFLINLAILAAFSEARWLGYLLSFTLGLAALPAFVAGLYCSYEELFEPPAGAARL